jgi:hypothetical protein
VLHKSEFNFYVNLRFPDDHLSDHIHPEHSREQFFNNDNVNSGPVDVAAEDFN